MSRRTGALNHVHKYYRLMSTQLWHCATCTHYMPGNCPPPIGKHSVCWECERHFILSLDNMTDTHPICLRCAVNKPAPELEESYEEMIERMMAEAKAKKRTTPDITPTEPDQIEVIEEDGTEK